MALCSLSTGRMAAPCRAAVRVAGVDAVVVATDDDRVMRAVEGTGAIGRMTASTHRTGTDRVAEVAAALNCEIVVNLQGDEPFVQPEMLHATIAPLHEDASLGMSTVCCPITDDADLANPNVVKLVRDARGRAL